MILLKEIMEIQDEVVKEYNDYPRRIIEDARGESNLSESEQGRFILELMQNADDAQTLESGDSESSRAGNASLIFHITKEYLYCANGGYPITRGGLEAICRAFLSPKRKSTPVIGFKGVGFKSILSITNAPQIFWQGGGVYFSRSKTLEIIEKKGQNKFTDNGLKEISILRYPHIIDFDNELKNDVILRNLIAQNATVFRFPFKSLRSREIALQKLRNVDANVMLFLNNLTKLELIIDDETCIIEISKTQIYEKMIDKADYKTLNAEISVKDNLVSWTLFNGIYHLPDHIRGDLQDLWKETDSVQITIAVETIDGHFQPLGDAPPLHVFFPTEQRVPFGFILHGTFRTNVDRRLLVDDDILNDFVVDMSLDLLREVVIPNIAGNIADPASIVDFFKIPDGENENNTEIQVWTKTKEILKDYKFIPAWRGDHSLSPREILLSPQDKNVSLFKELMPENISRRFCDDKIDTDKVRRKIIHSMGGRAYEVLTLPSLMEENFVRNKEWIGKMYAVLDKSFRYLEINGSPQEKTDFINECQKRSLLYTSSGKIANASSFQTDGQIFFPPTEKVIEPPEGIKLRFLDKEVVEKYMSIISGTIRDSFIARQLKVDEYSAISVITKTILPSINEFWEEWPKQKSFEPREMIHFLESLISASQVTISGSIKNLLRSPVPINDVEEFEEAFLVYASEKWTGNGDLEIIYSGKKDFLSAPDPTLVGEDFERLKAFYKQLGVSFYPRVLPQYEEVEPDKWSSSSWAQGKFVGTPHEKLPDWVKYCRDKYNDNTSFGENNPLSKYEVCLRTSYTLDGFEDIRKDSSKSQKLFELLSKNWERYANNLHSKISWREKSQQYYRESEVESYFSWSLKNAKWIPTVRQDLWASQSPRDLFVKNEEAYQELGDLLPTVDPRDSKEDTFLTHLGVRRGLNSLKPIDWWRIASNIPDFWDPDEKKVNPIYRKMLTIKDLDGESDARSAFLNNGKVLAIENGIYDFVSRNLVWYIEGEEMRRLFETVIPVFSIKHEENRGAAIKRVFDIKNLEDFIKNDRETGEEDEELTERLNQFLSKLKPFILARINKQRPSREENDVSIMRRLKISAVKGLIVNFELEIGDKKIKRTSDRGMYVDKARNTLFIDSTKFNLRNEEEWKRDVKFSSQLGIQVSHYMSADSADNISYLLGQEAENMYYILEMADISKQDVSRFSDLLGEVPEEAPSEVPIKVQEVRIDFVKEPVVSEEQINENSESDGRESRNLELWDPSEISFENMSIIKAEEGVINGSTNGKWRPGGGYNGRALTKEEQKRIEKTGIKLVFNFEIARHKSHGCVPRIESKEKENCGYDILSVCNFDVRNIEVKSSSGNMDIIDLTANEWDSARMGGDKAYLYRVENLDKSHNERPDIIIVQNPYKKLIGEPINFKVRLRTLSGKYERVTQNEDGQ